MGCLYLGLLVTFKVQHKLRYFTLIGPYRDVDKGNLSY